MKTSNPKKLAIINSLLIILFFNIVYLSTTYFLSLNSILQLVIISLLIFFFTFFIIRLTVEKFIYQKIRVIYKTIYNLKRSKAEKPDKKDVEMTSIENVNREVMEWSEKKKLEIEELKKAEVYRREFIGNIYHELKNPIFNIQGYVLTLLDGGLEDPTINRDYLLRTEKNINRMIAIVEDLETISKLETAQVSMNMSRFDIVEITREVFDSLEMKIRKKRKDFHFSINTEKPVFVVADKKWIRQVMVNLVDNSIKYGRLKGGKTKVGFFDMDENILIEVTDNGSGIDEEDLPRIFERFFRTNSGRGRDKSGTGLGLAIVKHIIEAHDQTVNVRSRPDVGTTFAFTLKKG
jgi:two-component system phosphate regulon sensor histidine kinase PhoR